MSILLDLSDICITTRGLATPLPAEPGYAYLSTDAEPVMGEEALSLAKIHPTLINNRYCGDLNTDPLSPPHPKVRHHADLLWYHLKKYKSAAGDSDFILLVPSSYSGETLKLLAGICRSLEIKVQAFVNRATAVAASLIESDKAYSAVHIDLQLHQTILSFLEHTDREGADPGDAGGVLRLTRTERLASFGLARLQEHWLHILRRRFIAGYRFDPMHSGNTEQQLFTQLCEQIYASHAGPFEFKVNHNGQQYVEQFSEKELAQPYQELLSEIQTKSQGLPLILDHYFAGIPGFNPPTNIAISNPDSVFEAASKMHNRIADNSVDSPFIDSAVIEDLKSKKPIAATRQTQDQHPQATHLLLGDNAYPADNYDVYIADQQLKLRAPLSDTATRISFNNGKLCIGENAEGLTVNTQQAAPGEVLRIGDRIALNGAIEEFRAIAVRAVERK